MNYKIEAVSATNPYYPFDSGKFVYLVAIDGSWATWKQAHSIGMSSVQWNRWRVTFKRRKKRRIQDMYKRMFANAPEWVVQCGLMESKNVNRNAYRALCECSHRQERYEDSHERYEYQRMEDRAETWLAVEDSNIYF